jgi:membrane-associated protein
MSLFDLLHSLSETIIAFGYLGIFVTIFAESGFLFGFFLPGDSLLFTLGILASQEILNIWILTPLLISAAILGDSFGYWMGKTFGPKLFARKESFFFKEEYLEKTEHFYQTHGKRTIVLARFIPVVRTFAPILAGAGQMKYSIFLTYNIMGGILWAGGITLTAYFLGLQIPWIKDYLEIIIISIIALSFIPVFLEFLKSRRMRPE